MRIERFQASIDHKVVGLCLKLFSTSGDKSRYSTDTPSSHFPSQTNQTYVLFSISIKASDDAAREGERNAVAADEDDE
jgi:hypothetical protein